MISSHASGVYVKDARIAIETLANDCDSTKPSLVFLEFPIAFIYRIRLSRIRLSRIYLSAQLIQPMLSGRSLNP
ncbi:hypothetical protein NDI45_16150 [Leptolyngbya sp. GB1-A1]|uniref:hypothetical protein n=1 Tax=Leptolyngbya sp. GB1-A1 TaxID=2933908 RepID=UPI0032973700